MDDDGDGLRDCADPDCEPACEDPCSAPEALSDPGTLRAAASPGRHSGLLSCGDPQAAPQLVYRFIPSRTGLLEVSAEGGPPAFVSIRSRCGVDTTGELDPSHGELACSLAQAQAPVTEGQPVYVVVEPMTTDGLAFFDIRASTRLQHVCADGLRDANEACDDGNEADGDGCDRDCQLESSEHESNGTIATASAFSSPLARPYYGQISPAGDIDIVSISLSTHASTLIAGTFNLGDGACGLNQLDSVLELLAKDGSVLASDDDSGDGLCALLSISDLAAGDYYFRIRAAEGAEPATFPYRLYVTWN